MTYAPADLRAVQRYAHDKTGQDWASLGIVGDTSHNSSGGYHVGHDVLHALGTAPEDPGSDYSYTDSRRDRNGLTDAASAFDLGGGFPRFLEFNAWMRQRMLAGDPRTADIREMIHTLDGRTVRRIDRTGRQYDGGDNSHLSHTHFSFFRDADGRRANVDNFFGLLIEFFDGVKPNSGGTDMASPLDDATFAAHFYALIYRVTALVDGSDVGGGPTKGQTNQLAKALKQIAADAAASKATDATNATAIATLQTVVTSLADTIKSGGGSVETAALLQKVQASADEVKAVVEQRHQEEVAAIQAESDKRVRALEAELEALRQAPTAA